MPAIAGMPATAGNQAKAKTQATSVTTATGNIKDDSMTTRHSGKASNSRSESHNRSANAVGTGHSKRRNS